MSAFTISAPTTLLLLAHVALAARMTVHALLHKRNPASATGWISLAWLVPLAGSVFYLLLGINRVERRARRTRSGRRHTAFDPPGPLHTGAGHLAPLEAVGGRISERRLCADNGFELLESGDEAYPRMLAALDGASTSIAIASYIFRADAAGLQFVDALTRAHARGVAVRVLVDGVGSGYLRSGAHDLLRSAGVPCARFMHFAMPWRTPFLNLRNHHKLLVVDGSRAFAGGLNIGAENLAPGAPDERVRDTHFSIEGPVVTQLADAFAEQWLLTTGERLGGAKWFPAVPPAGGCAARAVSSGPDQDVEKIELLILEAIACARKTIRIMTPYFLPDGRIMTALQLATLRGVEIDLVIPARCDHRVIDWAMRAHVEPLLATTCRVWLHGAPFDHSKLLTVDGAWCLIGSANWDTRSFRLNFELNIEAYSTSLARRLDARITARSTRPLRAADLARRRLPVKLRDAAARLMLPYL